MVWGGVGWRGGVVFVCHRFRGSTDVESLSIDRRVEIPLSFVLVETQDLCGDSSPGS